MAGDNVAQSEAVAEPLDGCRLEAVVPSSPSFDPGILSAQPQQGQSKAVLPQRTSLYLDETATIYVVFHSPYADENTFRALLARIEVNLETYAIGNPRRQQDDAAAAPQSVKDLVDTRTFPGTSEPLISVTRPEEDIKDGEGAVIVSWKTIVHISRPRIRYTNPSVYFAATLTLHHGDNEANAAPQIEYMHSGIPDSVNILEPFKIDPAFRKQAPVLSAARLAKVLPSGTVGKTQKRSLRSSSRPLLRLIPALNARARFSRIGASPTQAKVLASMDIDVTPWAEGHLQIHSLDVTLSDGRAENLDQHNQERLPISCQPRDSMTFVYQLIPNHFRVAAAAHSPMHTVYLTLRATAHPDPTRSHPLKISWRSPVDLTALYHKPTAFLPPVDPRLSTISSRTSNLDGRISQRSSTISTPFSSHLITMTVTGPSSIAVHATLRWSLLVTNRSPHRTLRLAIIPITSAAAIPADTFNHAQQQAQALSAPSKRTAQHKHKPTLSTSLFRPAAALDATNATAATLAKTSVDTTTQTSTESGDGRIAGASLDGDAGLIPLTADIRIGPLPPGACTTAEMRFLVLRAGVLPVEALRVVDLDGELQRTGAPGKELAWEEGGEVEGEGRRRKRRAWVDIGSEFLPDVIAVNE